MPEQVAPKNTALKAVVVILGILLLISMIIVISTIIIRSGKSDDELPEAQVGTALEDGNISVPVPPGARVKSLDIDRSRVLVVIESDTDSRILILDRLTGQPVRTVILSPDAPAN